MRTNKRVGLRKTGWACRGFSLLCIVTFGCQDPTQVRLHISTDTPYETGRQLGISASHQRGLEAEPVVVVDHPWDTQGQIGTMVVVPSEPGAEEPIWVRVVLGVAKDPTECTNANPDGCIIARRRLRFLKHKTVELPIGLHVACEGVACDDSSTCNALGQCVTSEVDPGECGSPGGVGCLPPGDELPTGVDAGPDGSVDAGPDGSVDAEFSVVGQHNLPGFQPFAVPMSGSRAFVSAANNIAALDISDFGNISTVKSLALTDPDSSVDAVVGASHWFAATGGFLMRVYDMNDIAVSPGSHDQGFGWSLGIVRRDNHLFIAGHNAGGVVLDVTNPASPTLTTSCAPTDEGGGGDGWGPLSVDVQGDVAAFGYSAERKQVSLYDVADPATCPKLGTYFQPAGVAGVALDGPHVYLASFDAGFEVVDFSTPASPTRVGGLPLGGAVVAVAVYAPTRALAATTDGKLHFIDVSKPSAPVSLSSFELSSDTPSASIAEFSKIKVANGIVSIGDLATGTVYFLRPPAVP